MRKTILGCLLFFWGNYSFGQTTLDQNIIETLPVNTRTKIKKSWKKQSDIPTAWIKVEQDAQDYLIYDPCDGNTPFIRLDSQYLQLSYGLETEKFTYEKLLLEPDQKSFRLKAYDNESKTWFDLQARIIDAQKGLVLWTFSGVQWLMTPLENKDKFRHIENRCLKRKTKELQFLKPKY